MRERSDMLIDALTAGKRNKLRKRIPKKITT